MISTVAPIRVMVVDDSAVIRGLLGRIIDAQPDMCVDCSVPNGRSALEMLRHRRVDLVLLDIEMPEMDGLTALPLILEARPDLPVIMASSLTQRGAEITMRALSLGAADYIPKPSALSAVDGMAAVTAELVSKVRVLGRSPRRRSPVARRESAAAVIPPPAQRAPGRDTGSVQVVAIAASTGGPNALSALFRALPRDLAVPVVIAQHMPATFTAALAERLQRESGRPTKEAVNGEPLLPGRTYVAPGDYHLTVMTAEGQPVARLDQSPPVNYCRPAADPMLRSVARIFGSSAVAVVLTGMGEDGLRGCEEIAQAGGTIIVQDEATSVVWGMPGAVFRAGLTSETLPIEAIAHRIQELCARPTAAGAVR